MAWFLASDDSDRQQAGDSGGWRADLWGPMADMNGVRPARGATRCSRAGEEFGSPGAMTETGAQLPISAASKAYRQSGSSMSKGPFPVAARAQIELEELIHSTNLRPFDSRLNRSQRVHLTQLMIE